MKAKRALKVSTVLRHLRAIRYVVRNRMFQSEFTKGYTAAIAGAIDLVRRIPAPAKGERKK